MFWQFGIIGVPLHRNTLRQRVMPLLFFEKNALPRWWNGRHEGLKIPWPGMAVRVRVPLAALFRVRSLLKNMKL